MVEKDGIVLPFGDGDWGLSKKTARSKGFFTQKSMDASTD